MKIILAFMLMLTEKLLSDAPLNTRGRVFFALVVAAMVMTTGCGCFVLVCFGLSLLR